MMLALVVNNTTYALQAAHIIPRPLGTPLLSGLVASVDRACLAFIAAFPTTPLSDHPIFADIQRISFPFEADDANMDDATNGYLMTCDFHNAKDRGTKLTINPVNQVCICMMTCIYLHILFCSGFSGWTRTLRLNGPSWTVAL
jgi:hypothetical protein